MGKIIISENVSLDGVVQDPDGEEGFRHGGWWGQFGGKDLEEWGKVALDDAPAVDDQDLAGLPDRGQAMRDHQRGTAR